MHRIVAPGGLPVERRDVACPLVDGEGAGFAAIAVHRVEMRSRAVEGEERRILQPAQMLDVGEGAGAAVDAIDVDAVALAVALGRGVAADIGEEGTRHWTPRESIPYTMPLIYGIGSDHGYP